MRNIAGLATAAMLTLSAQPVAAQSQEQTIAGVRAFCAEWKETDFAKVKQPFLAGYCIGLIQGFRTGATVGMASTIPFFKEKVTYSGPEKRTGYERWCIPSGVTNQQLAGAFMSWSSDKQDYWHLPYSIGFYEAFKQEFPCTSEGESATPSIEVAPAEPTPQK